MSHSVTARAVGHAPRRPKTFGEGRVCGDKACPVRLSRYNRAERCFNHAPARFPRLRGEFSDEYSARHA